MCAIGKGIIGNWTLDEALAVVNTAKSEGRDRVTLDMDGADWMNEKTIEDGLTARGYIAARGISCIVVAINKEENKMSLSYDEIRTKIDNKDYNTKLPYPDRVKETEKSIMDANTDKSVQWCRDELERLKAEYKAKSDEYRKDGNRLEYEFRQDIIDMITAKTGKPNQAVMAYSYAYQEGHSSGYGDVLTIADDILDILVIQD